MSINYRSREELVANIKLAIAKKNEHVARVQREWAEQDVKKIRLTV